MQISKPESFKESKGETNSVFQDDNLKNILHETDGKESVLKFAFRKADENSDGHLTIREISKYINSKICGHIDEAIKRNPAIFSSIDKAPPDGLVSWGEYHSFFLKNLRLGLDDNYIKSHDEKKHVKLDRKSKEALMRDKARWGEVMAADPTSLTLDEFLSFQHPEASTSNLLNLVDEILHHFDSNGDDLLTADEFTNTYSSSTDNKKLFLSDNINERLAEFKKLIDKDHDGQASRQELLQFVDPRNPRFSIQEAIILFDLADANKDKKLTLDEMLNKHDLFMSSKFINLIENFHNEF